MPRWTHSKKEVRRALDDAAAANFIIKESSRGHCWGKILCPNDECGGQMSVWSTPSDQDDHADQIRRFVRRHKHEQDLR